MKNLFLSFGFVVMLGCLLSPVALASESSPPAIKDWSAFNGSTLADNNRSDRRDDRQDDRGGDQDGRQDCRDEEGVAGKDKRDCKQDERRGPDDA
jgi:hypothetical protein